MDDERSIRARRPAPKGEDDRGRYARKPSEIKWRGWKDIFWRVWNEQSRDRLSMVAAGVAFYAMLAVFPALAAVVSIYGLAADPQTIQTQLNSVSGVMPQEAFGLINDQLQTLVRQPAGKLSLTLLGSLLVTLWSANNGMKSLIEALNIVYNEEEKRGFFKLNVVSLGFTLTAILFGIVALSLVVAVPAFIGKLAQAFGGMQTPILFLRWVPLAILIMIGLAVIYRYAPSRRAPHWRWVTWGSAGATILWLVASMLFSFYVSHFGSYNKMYGSVGAVVVLMMWFYLTAFIVLLGAETDSEMEHQTVHDTTVGGGKADGTAPGVRGRHRRGGTAEEGLTPRGGRLQAASPRRIAAVRLCLTSKKRPQGSAFCRRIRSRTVRTVTSSGRTPSPAASSSHPSGIETGPLLRARAEYGATLVDPRTLRK